MCHAGLNSGRNLRDLGIATLGLQVPTAKSVEEFREIDRVGCLETHQRIRGWVTEGEQSRMKRLPWEGADKAAERGFQLVGLGEEGFAVFLIAQQRMADMGHVNANLVGAPRFEPAFHQRPHGGGIRFLAEAFLNGEMGDGMARVGCRLANHRLSGAIRSRSTQRRIDRPGDARRRAPDQRVIGAFEVAGAAVVGECLRQCPVGSVVLGDDEHAARILIQPVHNTRPANAANTGQRCAAVVDERIDQRARPVARSWVDDKTRGLVDDYKVVVLEQDVERYVLPFGSGRFRLGHRQHDAVAHRQLALGLGYGRIVDADRTFADQRLDAAARQVRAEARGKPLIDTLAACIGDELFQCGFGFVIRIAHRSTGPDMPMAAPLDDEQEKPLDPAVERVRRKLVRFVAINLGLLFLALMAVVVAIVYRASRVEEPASAAVSELPMPADGTVLEGEIALPRGARIVSHALSGSVLSLQLQLPDGERSILLYDTVRGEPVGRFAVREAQ